MVRSSLTVIVCAPSNQKKAILNVGQPFAVVTTEKLDKVSSLVARHRPGTVRLFHTPNHITNKVCNEVKEHLNGHTPPMYVVRNPHEKDPKEQLCELVKEVVK